MSVAYKVVTWNRNKLVYDAILLALIAGYLTAFLHFAPAAALPPDEQARHIRAYGSLAFLMLTVILCIGPLSRIDTRFLPLLYNRRHFGVMTFAVALAHGNAVLGWYFAYSPANPYVALLSSNTSFARLAGFPFETLGLAALLILAVLAVTSHDFWLHFFGAPLWKALHMMVYAAFALIVAHVSLGAMMEPGRGALALVVGGCAVLVTGLHLFTGWRTDPSPAPPELEAPWLNAGAVSAIADGRAIKVTFADGTSAAVFRQGTKLSAVSNACAHQNGPLSEGRVVDGCITCPWHGYQYRLHDGCSPPPFTEKIATYRLKLVGGDVWIDPRANPEGTPVEPVLAEAGAS